MDAERTHPRPTRERSRTIRHVVSTPPLAGRTGRRPDRGCSGRRDRRHYPMEAGGGSLAPRRSGTDSPPNRRPTPPRSLSAQSLIRQGQLDEARQTLLEAGPEILRGWEWGWLHACMQPGPDDPGRDGVRQNDAPSARTGDSSSRAVRTERFGSHDLQTDSPPQVLRGGPRLARPFPHPQPRRRTAITTHERQPAKVWDLEKKASSYSVEEDSEAGSPGRPSSPTGRPSPPEPPTAASDCGTWNRANRSGISLTTKTERSWPWPSVRTAGNWPGAAEPMIPTIRQPDPSLYPGSRYSGLCASSPATRRNHGPGVQSRRDMAGHGGSDGDRHDHPPHEEDESTEGHPIPRPGC